MIAVKICDLEGRSWAAADFRDADRAWEWVAVKSATKFGCRERDIDCVGADDTEHDFVTAHGKVVARVHMQSVKDRACQK